ncbi:cytoskeleton protein RodZ [mine drainage metagenome]|uniref:Cytoskeleton protein RodZ n=1 Tax=mine drainage metagenome TaxID=410659 RepID=A0A1J5TF34_9ZZZZ
MIMIDELVVNVVNPQQSEVSDMGKAEIQVGAVLLAARKAKSFTQQDVSNALRLSLKQIEALEHDDFSALPDAMITRGFIRNYARFLAVDAEPLLAGYKAQVPDKSPNALSVQSSMHQVVSSQKHQPWIKYGLIGVLLFSLLAWFVYMNYMSKLAKPSVEKLHEVVMTPAPPHSSEISLPEVALPAAERQVGDVSPDPAAVDNMVSAKASNEAAANSAVGSHAIDVSAVNTNKANESVVAAQSGQVPAPQAQANKMPVVSIKVAPPVSEAKLSATTTAVTKKVSVSATERSWVSVTNQSGQVVFEKMLSAGSEETFDGSPPMNVVIGNAKATKLVFSGKPIDLTVSAKSNVAHLVLE